MGCEASGCFDSVPNWSMKTQGGTKSTGKHQKAQETKKQAKNQLTIKQKGCL